MESRRAEGSTVPLLLALREHRLHQSQPAQIGGKPIVGNSYDSERRQHRLASSLCVYTHAFHLERSCRRPFPFIEHERSIAGDEQHIRIFNTNHLSNALLESDSAFHSKGRGILMGH